MAHRLWWCDKWKPVLLLAFSIMSGAMYFVTWSSSFPKEATMSERAHQVLCETLDPGGQHGVRSITSRLLYNQQHSLLYCPVEKIASTFTKRLFAVLSGKFPTRNPFTLTVGLGELKLPHLSANSSKHIGEIFEKSYSFLTVRDPYSRIFSAYVDKIFDNTAFYLRSVDVGHMKKLSRHGEPSSTCGHDVTFPEFVKYVSHTEVHPREKSDPHWTPISDLCRPCDYHYKHIAKMETFQRDIVDIIMESKISKHVDMEKIESTATIPETINKTVYRAFNCLNLTCVTRIEKIHRAWAVLQVRGLISYKLDFTTDKVDENHITQGEFMDLVTNARQKIPMSLEDIHFMKTLARKKAYSMIPDDDIERFVSLFHEDFVMFGYDKERPDENMAGFEDIAWNPFLLQNETKKS